MSLSKEKNYILHLLSKQDYSRKQLLEKLNTRANISSTEINSLLDDFEKRKWLCDERFASTFIQSEVNKLRGRKRILNTAIYQKGLSEELIQKCFDELDIDWYDLCKQCLNKKYHDISKLKADVKLKQKATNYLIYNGFSFEEINSVF